MKNKTFLIIIILAVIGVGLIAGAAIYYPKTLREETPSPVETAPFTERYSPSADKAPAAQAETEPRSTQAAPSEEYLHEDEITEAIKNETIKHGGISPGFKKFWDDYESFMDSYAPVMNDKSNPDYKKLSARYDDYVKKAAEYESSEDLTAEEVDYMTSAHARISAKYASAWLGETE